MATVFLAVRSSGRDAEESSDGGREIIVSRHITFRKMGQELTHEPRNARVVAASISPSSFDHSGINSDVQAFLWHDDSYAYYNASTIRIIKKPDNSRDQDRACAEGGIRDRFVLQRLTSWVAGSGRLAAASVPTGSLREEPGDGRDESKIGAPTDRRDGASSATAGTLSDTCRTD